MPPSNVADSQDLKYPPVHISHSLQKLDLDTLIMRSTSRRLQDEPGGSLEDSTFEFLGDSLIETSDDEAHTESIASTDGYTPDDASSFSDDDADYGTDTHELQNSTSSLSVNIPGQQEQHSESLHSTGDSTFTEVPAHEGEGSHASKIRLDEQPGQDDGVSQGSKVIRSFPDDTGIIYPVFDQYKCSEVRLVVKAALSDKLISTPESYRILYIGMPDKWVEDVITSKISAALMAGPSTSRSIMVQGQLEPYGPIMHVDRCTDTHILSSQNQPARIALNLDNGQRLVFGPKCRSSSEGRPDLVIFSHPSEPQPSTDIQDYAPVRQMFDREQVPYLDVTSIRLYGHGAPSYDSRSLSVCIEGREDSEADYELKEVLPIDHYTFNDLEPTQVNRHLALISPHMVATDKSAQTVQAGSMWSACAKQLRSTQPDLVKTVTILTVLSAMVMAYLFNPVLMPMLQGGIRRIDTGPVTQAYTPELCSTPLNPSSTLAAVVASAPSITNTPMGLTVVPVQAKPAKQVKRKAEKLSPFEIQPTDDHQFTLLPNKDLLNARKKPQLQIQVSRETHAVPIRYNRTLAGIYVVDLEQQYPFGNFNVSIASYSKPLLQQSFEIALGHNKSMLDQLLDSAVWELSNTQSSLGNVSAKVAHQFLASMTEIEVAARLLTKEIRQSSPKLTAHLRDAKELVKHRLSSRAEYVKHVPEVAWASMQEITAPIRRSSQLSKLRSRAIWARCQAEKAAGLSRSGGEGKESWSCSKMRELS
jgi:hypothetical protein